MKSSSSFGYRSPIYALALSVALGAQQPTFRATVEMVQVVCTVFDRRGNYIPDLTAEDFEIYENGRPQVIQFFGSASTGEAPPIFLVLTLDTSTSVQSKLDFEQQTGLEFLKATLRSENDRAAVVQFSSSVRLISDFTADPSRLRIAVADTRAHGGTRMYDALWLSASQLLAKQAGRRVLVLFSDGGDVHSHLLKEEALRKLQTEQVTVFAVGVEDPSHKADFGVLQEICEATGGLFTSSEAGLRQLRIALARIHDEITHQYILAYTSDNGDKENPFREIDVKVKRRETQVKHRQGYFIE